MTVDLQAVKTDLYEAVNGEWSKTAQIPADRPATGGFQDLVIDIEKLLMDDLEKFASGEKELPNEQMAQAVKLYQLALDFDRRASEGTSPLQVELDQIEALQSYEDYQSIWHDWLLTGNPSPVDFDLDTDMKNAKVYGLYAGAPTLILPEKNYYADDNQQGQALLQVWTTMAEKVLVMVGYDQETAQKLVSETKAFDARLVPHVKSAEERADYSKMYNPMTVTEFAQATEQLSLSEIIKSLIKTTEAKVIVTEPAYFQALDQILADHFAEFKSWLTVKTILGDASVLTDDLRIASGEYSRTLSGSQEAVNHQKFAYYFTMSYFGQVIGKYYGETYFGPEAKANVEYMVHQMIKVYQERLENNDWLSPATRQQAIVKLTHLGVQVGYPEKLPAYYEQLKIDTGKSLLANAITLSQQLKAESFSRWNQPVDQTRWEMSAATVNAYYHPFMNIIVFPAAILQAPFYSLQQTSSQNYGGIGAVIAHEISHAFDNNGSLFDEYGNLKNWWTEEDQSHFKALAEKMVKEFDGLPYAGQSVNGKLTVSENIADAGGLSCALSAAQEEADYNAQAFFLNWARVWRMKATEQYMQLLLSIDVHAPNKLRANVQAQNLTEFYPAFDIQPGDQMYLEPDQRVQIW
ncbi:M13 family peptidase [Limosilactobacillus gastricus]|uniref:Endopeptidase n=1 Tax=Limosilactobacillus gastricus DSM 16045 TaxID=1423749 RepID=A0A0R1V5Z7_9LACO|nr:M13-type metalloendopeptidase [Limosilactobacillus gastricus]KRM00958.1 Endopeptidase [Limosilactobacillus gastricus DSM 16045]QGF41191.1 M13 family peptidase [Limosilactobacillus gastricus]